MATPGPGQGSTTPPVPPALPADVPIDHVIFIIKENRTFDHYFGTYPGADGATTGGTMTCNADKTVCEPGPVVPLKPALDVQPHDIEHGYFPGIASIDGGRMDGFNTIPRGGDLSGYTQFDRAGIPNYWKYADRFVLTDRFFTSMYGPTYPEHLYTVAAQSDGIMDNKAQLAPSPGRYCDDPLAYSPAFRQNLTAEDARAIMGLQDQYNGDRTAIEDIIMKRYTHTIRSCFNIPTLPQKLSQAGVSWKFYSDVKFPIGDILRAVRPIRHGSDWNNVVASNTFLSDIRHGDLASVSWVNPPAIYNEHPELPGRVMSVCAGEDWSVEVMNAIQRSPDWESTVVVMIWDDFGGFYDHVVPPRYDIMGLGPRTPGLIMSPYSRVGSNALGGSIDHTTYEFSSVLHFIEEIFGIQPMTDRDRLANPLLGALDFNAPPRLDPLILPIRKGKDCPYFPGPVRIPN